MVMVKLYKEDAQPNNDNTVNDKDDDMSYESENCSKPWKHYKEKKIYHK